MALRKKSLIDLSYIAGFLDGDGSIVAQIVPDKSARYKFVIRLSINFYQKKTRHWFILFLYKTFDRYGFCRVRNDDISVYTITGFSQVKEVLLLLYPFLRIKKPTARLMLKILDQRATVKTKDDFLEVCKLVDKVSFFTDSKNRKITSEYVKNVLYTPVET